MTRPKKPRNTNTADLPDRILAALKREQVQTVEELAIELGFSKAAITTRLRLLREKKHIHCAQIRANGGRVLRHLWIFGATPRIPYELTEAQAIRYGVSDKVAYAGMPMQRTTKDYVIDACRDVLVAALFGPAHKEAT